MTDPAPHDRPGYRPGGVTGKGFRPGQSGNPGGRPKGRTLTGILRELMEREHNGRPVIEILAERVLREALTGKFPFAKEVWDRVEGRVTEKHDVSVKPMTLQEKVALITEDELIDMAVRHDLLDKLPTHLRERARKQLSDRRGGPP
jgi:hypothetical protein